LVNFDRYGFHPMAPRKSIARQNVFRE